MEEEIISPEEEIKRADHLIYVTLKYTRTCDVMKNAVKRMVSAFEMAIQEYLEGLRKARKTSDVPATAKERAVAVKGIIGSPVRKYMVLYNMLKKIEKTDYTAVEEFRKNVTMKIKSAKPLDVKVKDLYEYLEKTREFVAFLKDRLKK